MINSTLLRALRYTDEDFHLRFGDEGETGHYDIHLKQTCYIGHNVSDV
jgi:hypothetical protein